MSKIEYATKREVAAVAMVVLDIVKYIEAEFDVDVVAEKKIEGWDALVAFVEDIEGR